MSGSIIIKKSSGATTATTNDSRAQRPRVPGVFPGTQFGEQVVSTGIPSLDGYIGGGVPLGSVVVIKDDYPSKYADLILRCFIAEGASYNHYLFVATGHTDSAKFADELPSLKKESRKEVSDSSDPSKNPEESEKLKIAWRYKDAAPRPATLSSRGGIVKGQKVAKFEFTKRCTVKDLGGAHLTVSKLVSSEDFLPPTPLSLLREIAAEARAFDITNKIALETKVSNLLRIGLSHCDQVLDPSFMFGLRCLVQSTNSCAVLTLSTLSTDPGLLSRVEHMADIVMQVETVLDKKKKEELGNVDGLCKVQKINSLNGLKLFVPPSDLGFSYKHKRITFQELHLPPEGENTAQREAGHPKSHHTQIPPSSSCGSKLKGASIDF